MLSLVSRWFEPVSVPQRYGRREYAALWLILAVGVFLRFWGLGNVGLHGDEETMAMPAMAILETGHPYLPSGMYYPRALIQIYLMSGSAWLFGASEWAFRLPSAIVGSLAGLAAFFMGRRFLSPHFNLAFVATITLLPGMIEASQTARMYIFFVTCVIWFAACIFRWERDQRISSLLLAILVWLLALHFQNLAIFAAPLFLFPGLSRQSWRQLVAGIIAFVAGFVSFELYKPWIRAKYPSRDERPPPLEEIVQQTPLEVMQSGYSWLLIASLLLAAIVCIPIVVRIAKGREWGGIMPFLLLMAGLVAIAMLHFHVGGILLLFGVIFWLRSPRLPRSWLIACLACAGAIAVAHLGTLYASGLYPGRKVIGAVIGTPSIWPILRFLEYSPVSGAIYGAAIALMLIRFAQGRPLPIHFLFFSMVVWLPLLIIGYFAWYVPPRYAMGQLPYFMLCVLAGSAYMLGEIGPETSRRHASKKRVVALAILVAVLISPWNLARTVNPDYHLYPDHKGAAEYIKSLEPDSDRIVIAEDVLQQTYYLGRVDYWLREFDNARRYTVVDGDRVVDLYTSTELIGTGMELESVLDNAEGRDVYIIGSGENVVGEHRLFRGRGIDEVLLSDRLAVVYEGRDGKTLVWRLVE